MTERCPHETSVYKAVRTGQWSATLSSHVSECADCSEVEQVARFMGNVRERLGATSTPLPSPDVVWLKAELEERHGRAKREVTRVLFREAVARIAVGFLLALAALWTWPRVDLFIGQLRDMSWELAVTSFQNPATLYTVPLLIMVAGFVTYILGRPLGRGFIPRQLR